ncbi:hypothetical protein KPP03845_100149 [Streptomyces xanthophaeus]|nr:hypothetical protein KPP03845_100149 [Streptomyces xanthophaeus]
MSGTEKSKAHAGQAMGKARPAQEDVIDAFRQ